MVSFSIGSKGYVGLGDDGNNVFSDFWEYDPSTDTWTQKANFPGVARTTAVGFSSDTKGYVGCGDASPGLKKDFWEYDPISNTWTQKANFGGTARSDANGFFIGGKGYIGVGEDASGFKQDFWEYDPLSNSWTQKANYGGGNRSTATAFTLNNKGYIGAGDNGTALKNDFWEWSPSTNTWMLITPFPGANRSDMMAFTIGNKAYAGNGNTCGGSCYINDWYEFSSLTNSIQNINQQQLNLNVFPNPTSGLINIEYEKVTSNKLQLSIYDVIGQQTINYELSTIDSKNSIDLSSLNNGIYIFEILNDGLLIKKDKIIITK